MKYLPEPSTIVVNVSHEDLDGLRILHISDLHISKKTSRASLEKLVDVCDGLSGDFVALTGDVIDAPVKLLKDKLEILNSMSSRVYWISGNHDIFYGLEDLKKELNNFIFMDNEREFFTFNEKKIHIVGLPDRFSKFFKIKRDVDEIVKRSKENSPTIFLSHQPKDFKIAAEANASLFLCGHTHGGQIFPFHYIVRLVQPFLKGLRYRDKMAIYVNSGLGTWGLRHRYKAPSEISLLKLSYGE